MAADPGTPPPITTRGQSGFSIQLSAFITWIFSFYAWLVDVKNAFTYNAISGTSVTSLTIGTGTQSLTTQTAKSFLPGQAVVIAITASPSNYMVGIVQSYNSGTGALVVIVPTGGTSGSGTATAWTISIAAFSQLTADSVIAQYLGDSSQGLSIVNGELLVPAPSASAITASLKTLAGSDPSATDPVIIVFRDVSQPNGACTVLSVTAATSVTLSSGSTCGTASGIAHRLYMILMNDGGTVRLGVYNPLDATNNLLALDESALISSTAEGGAGAADSGQVVYSTVAVTSKAFRIGGYFESSQATAGTWASTPTKVQMMGPGVRKSGDIVQRRRLDTGTVSTGTTLIPLDNTIPQITEGTQFMSRTITPLSAANLLAVNAQANLSNSANARVSAALFRDAGANALDASQNVGSAAATMVAIYLNAQVISNTTSSTSFSVNGGNSVAGTTTFNGESGTQLYGGVTNSYIEVTEVHV